MDDGDELVAGVCVWWSVAHHLSCHSGIRGSEFEFICQNFFLFEKNTTISTVPGTKYVIMPINSTFTTTNYPIKRKGFGVLLPPSVLVVVVVVVVVVV